jgi:uncharacterized membrane protein YdjX (TVP38/TMEM64 family)
MRTFSRRSQLIKFLLLAVMTIALILIVKQIDIKSTLQLALKWVEQWGIWAPIGFILLYNVATVLLLPGAVLTLGGGVLFGLWWGTVYVLLAATLGATIAFLIGRHWARDWVLQKVAQNQKFRAIDAAVAQQGFKIVLLTRLSPLFPFNLLNYVLGITQVSLRDYVLGSIGMFPGTLLYVYIGSLAGSLTMLGMPQDNATASLWLWASKIIGFLATIGVTVYVTRLAKSALNASLES